MNDERKPNRKKPRVTKKPSGPKARLPRKKRGRRATGSGAGPVIGFLDGALACAEVGLQIVPIVPGEKRPLIKDWVNRATTDPEQIKAWLKCWPEANVGVVTGHGSGVVVIDIDPRNGGDETLEALEVEHGPLTAGWETETGGGGRHLYFRVPEGVEVRCSAGLLGPGIDIRGEGGCVTVPPSRLKGGGLYRWINDTLSRGALTPLPEWVLAAIQKRTRGSGRSKIGPASSLGGVHEAGVRNSALTRLAGVLRCINTSEAAIRAALYAQNEIRCRPPLPADEVDAIVESILRYKPKADLVALNDPHRLADLTIDRRYTKRKYRMLAYHQGHWWIWEANHYRRTRPEAFRAMLNSLVRGQLDEDGWVKAVGSGLVTNVLEAMSGKLLLPEETEPNTWIGPKPRPGLGDVIAMENGLLSFDHLLKGRANPLCKPTPTWFSETCLPYPFEPEAECPGWLGFLEEVLPDPRARDLLQEFLGYCLTYDTSRHKFLILVGEGSNGKSVVTEVATQVLGDDNVSHIGLERFVDRFALAPMIGRLANIVSEIAVGRPVAEEILKAMASGDKIQVEFKYQSSFSVKPTARLIFATNELPRFADRSGGIWRRVLLLPFDVTIPPERQDPHLARTICETELPGIFNWAVDGLQRLHRNTLFTEPDASRRLLAQLRRESNPAREFLTDAYESTPDRTVPCRVVYGRYADWCRQQGLRPLTESQLGKEVKRVFPKSEHRQMREGGGRAYVYVGVGPRLPRTRRTKKARRRGRLP